MTRWLGALLTIALVSARLGSARADEKADAILEKGIQALGGREKLEKADATETKAKGTIRFGEESEATWKIIAQGTDRLRTEFSGERGEGIFVIAGDKGWRKFGADVGDLDGPFFESQKQSAYLTAAATRLVPLKGKGFKYEAGGEEKVGGKPAVALKCTDPDGKAFTLYLDKESGLPMAVRNKAKGFQGEDFDQETTYDDYKDFDGIKRATKVVVKRDGEPFITQTITDVKVLDKVPADTFAAPK